MGIKHLPCGLFPHFDSGLERRPFLACAGDLIEIGCRLDDSDAEQLFLELGDGSRLEGTPGENRDVARRYYRFSVRTSPDMERLTYRFVASNGEKSPVFAVELLRRQTLYPTKTVCDARGADVSFSVDGKEAAWRLRCTASGLDVQFLYHLNVKIQDDKGDTQIARASCGDLHLRFTDRLEICDNVAVLALLDPAIQIWTDASGAAYALHFTVQFRGRAFYGLGEKYDRVEQSGREPLNFVVEQYANQQDKTYAPIPFFYTDSGIGFLQTNTYRSRFSIAKPEGEFASVTISARCPREGVLFSGQLQAGNPAGQIAAYQHRTGAAVLPPIWAFGPWMSSNGWNTQAEALAQVDAMRELAIPATVMVLEAWSDEETFYIWNDAQYVPRRDGSAFQYEDFTFPADGKWPDPQGFIRNLSDNGLKLVLWQIPVIKYEAQPHGEQLDLDTAYALENGLCIQNADGSPYRITEMWFGNSLMPDFTNANTRAWWFEKRRYLVETLGVAGFKTDGGEFLFDETAVFSDGRSVLEGHNDYPNLYEGAYHAFLRETMGPGRGVTFSRVGYTGAQRYPLHWAGDQISTFAELRGQLTAGLSFGLSGVPFWGFDIGGFAGEFPSTELYLRATALAAFSPVMQFHSEPRYGQYYMTAREHWNNDRSPWNMAAANRDERIIPIYRLFANLRMNLLPYIYGEAKHCSASGRPLMAHLIYDFLETEGEAVLHLEDQYLFGRSLLVAPVICEHASGRDLYLPAGRWYDFWTGDVVEGGHIVEYPCPWNRIPVFVRENAMIPVNLNKACVMGTEGPEGAVSNRLDRYEQLAFLLYGPAPAGTYADGRGNRIAIKDGRLQGIWRDPVVLLPMCGQTLVGGDKMVAEVFASTVNGRRYRHNSMNREDDA